MNSNQITERLDQWVAQRAQLPLSTRKLAAKAARIRRLYADAQAATGALVDVKA